MISYTRRKCELRSICKGVIRLPYIAMPGECLQLAALEVSKVMLRQVHGKVTPSGVTHSHDLAGDGVDDFNDSGLPANG